jgi:phosphoesterase RecJ-like protein
MPHRLIEFCEGARAAFESANHILLASHVFPEADSVGSEAALAWHLTRLGKRVVVRNPTPVQEIYRFLIDLSGLSEEAWADGSDNIPAHDLIVLLDVSDWDYMGSLGDALRCSRAPKILFDHHQSPSPIGTFELIDPEASATGEVLYRYFLATGAEIDARMAAALYASILFDTGGFRFRSTRDETLLIAAELIRRGANHRETAARLFENESFPRVELLTAALGRLVSDLGGRIAWTYVTREMFARTETTAVDADGIIDHLMTVRGVELAILFRELPDRNVKVTFRSKGKPDVSRLAEDLGGGGRPTASGVTLGGSLKEAISTVVPRVRAVCADTPEIGEGAPGAVSAPAAAEER